MAARRNKKTKGLGVMTVLVVVLCLGILLASASLQRESEKKQDRIEELNGQIALAREEADRLEAKKNISESRKFIEEVARKILGLVYPDEILFEEEK